MKKIRFVVVANCQARPVADLLTRLSARLEICGMIITHLASKDSEEADLAILRSADLIFAQLVTEQYHAAHLATSRLKQEFGARVVSWPNIYFRGQCPDLSYAGVAGLPRLQGPLRDYHLRSVYVSWRNGDSHQGCLSILQNADPGYSSISTEIAVDSLAELQTREAMLDVGVADIINRHWRDRRLFFTFNHPTLYLLTKLSSRLLAKVDIEQSEISWERPSEPLALVVPPVLRREADSFGQSFAHDTIKGAALQIADGRLVMGKSCSYRLEDLVAQFYSAYDSQITRDAIVKFSPGPTVYS